jgi:hypothetical protein
VRVTRRGGLAGLTKAAELEIADTVIEDLLARGDSGPPHPDGFEYRFELPDGRAVTVPEHELPRDLLDDFAQRAKPLTS